MVKSIEESFMDRGDLFGLEFHEGYVFLAVESWSLNQFRPYTDIGEVNPSDSSETKRLEDSSGDDIIYTQAGQKKVLHVGIGQRPASLRRYTYFPENAKLLHQVPNLTASSARSGDNYGFVDGTDTPYDEPSDAEELVIPPGIHLNFTFFNPNQNDSVVPSLNIRMREYNVSFLDPKEDIDQIKRVISPGSPMPIYNVGTLDSKERLDETDWDAQPMSPTEVGKLRRR
jgi:hypothetical protein